MAIQGRCHCGKTRFEIDFVPRTARRCTCTFCTKRGALWASVPPGQLRLLTPREDAKAYGRNPLNRHYFCATCGCSTFSETPRLDRPAIRSQQPAANHQPARAGRFRHRCASRGSDRRTQPVVSGVHA